MKKISSVTTMLLVALMFSTVFLFSNGMKPKTPERILAYIEIVQIGEDIWARTSYDTRVFDNECAAKQVVAANFLKTCVDTTEIKTKKL